VTHLTTPHEGGVRWAYDPMHKPVSPTPFQAAVFGAFVAKVTCPVLFVGGGETGYHPPDEEERLAGFSCLVRAEIADAGHMMHWTRPEALAAHLVGFLAKHLQVPEVSGVPCEEAPR